MQPSPLIIGCNPLECAKDAKATVRWVRANEKLYGIDPDRIEACRDSAGTSLVAMLATTGGISELEGTGGNIEVSSRIQAAVGFSTPALTGRATWPWKWTASVPSRYNKISPYKHISADDTPLLFLHGLADGIVDPLEPQDMYNKYKSLGIYTEIELFKDLPHVFYTSEIYAEKALIFLEKIFNCD